MFAPQLQFQGIQGFDQQQQQQNLFPQMGLEQPQGIFFSPANTMGQPMEMNGGQMFADNQGEFDPQGMPLQDGFQAPMFNSGPAPDNLMMGHAFPQMQFNFYPETTAYPDTPVCSTPVNNQFVDVSLDTTSLLEEPKRKTRAAEVKKIKSSKFGCC